MISKYRLQPEDPNVVLDEKRLLKLADILTLVGSSIRECVEDDVPITEIDTSLFQDLGDLPHITLNVRPVHKGVSMKQLTIDLGSLSEPISLMPVEKEEV